MKTRIGRLVVVALLTVGMAGLSTGCSSTRAERPPKEFRVSVPQMSGPARAQVEYLTMGGTIQKIDKEIERGRRVYDVEATVAGKHVEFLIADSDGAVLGMEVPIKFSELPELVRNAAEKYFGNVASLKAMKGVEFGETSYEIEGPKNGKTVEVTFDPTGKRVP